ncbi:alpha/beta fold hydrolase [Azospirillum rugosum]|uniref:Pimeloyl-ACP methyl ester carboxylesterase n=1 Tax=Azospirillum rugosum TaxID=416170 RepID=A0ABS4SR59_9PROT|nr:alpha/beta hydrolase [Azospirillum rugosum]MBP2294427.1 pimeloyl-ACP methyl ester carboxylesterase [Azospirillum rugosum]MDQ0528932.1 pimeloyl-ACP methyl ester carboxylesterase [Azospirillum rugosum]
MPMSERSFLGLSAAGFHKVAYTQWGRDDAPRTAVCVHGLTRNGRDFDALALDLADGWRVACPDVVGRGKSGWLANPALYGYPQYCADMAALVARLGVEQVDWVGTSMGGLIGLMLAAQPNSPIRRLVINDVGPFVSKIGLQRIADYVGKDPVFEDIAAVESYLRFVLMGFGRLPDEAWRHMAEHSARTRPDGRYGLAYDPGIAEAFKAQPMQDVDLWAFWDRIQCPVLVLRGATSDILLRETAEEMTRRGPRARVVEFANTGHAPALMTEDQIAAVRGFLLEG